MAGNWQEEYRTCALVGPRRREAGLLNDLQIELTSEMLPVRFFPSIRSHTNTRDQPGGSDATTHCAEYRLFQIHAELA